MAGRAFLRPILIAAAALVLLMTAVAGVTVGPLLFAPNRYADVLSIETGPTYRDRALIDEAWRLPVARRYRAHGLVYQSNQSFCGPASIASLMGSIGQPMSQQAVIAGTTYEPWFGILLGGLTLDELGALTHLRTGRPVELLRGLTLADFRRHLAASNDPARRYLINFHRGPLFGRGHGHHAPILGYLARQDLVLVGDVNPAYRPFLVSSERLWRAAGLVDDETARPRGLALVRLD